MRTVQRWLGAVVRQKRVIRVGKGPLTRYILPAPVLPDPLSSYAPVARALHQLVTQPLAERAPADYRRVALERYVPNETCYVPADVRARMSAASNAGAWRQPPQFAGAVLTLASRCLWLEEAISAVMPAAGLAPKLGVMGPLSDADLAAWLTQPERPGVRTDAQLAWNIRAILTEWAARPPAAAVTPDLLQSVFDRVHNRLQVGGAVIAQRALAPHARDRTMPAFLRASPLTLPATVYEPPADRWSIKTCFETVLRLSQAIADPVERAFFLLTHLLYLLPFSQGNATIALLTINVPLLAANPHVGARAV